MKKFFLAATFFAAAFVGNAQMNNIPATVTTALKAKYPDAQTVSWKHKLSSYEASFVLNGTKTDAYFKSTGDWLETDKATTFDDLPSSVKDGFNKSKYTDWKTTNAVEIKKPSGTQYRVDVRKSDVQMKYLYFAPDGSLAKEAMTL
jgi:hypothetical protein